MTKSIPKNNCFLESVQGNEYDVIVVGQGLAGSVLVNQLHLQGKRVAVFENNHINTASWAAIGIHNPLIIKRLRKSWRAKEFINYCIPFYKNCEEELKVVLRHDIEIHRIFANAEEEKIWQEKTQLLAWMDYIENGTLDIFNEKKHTGKVKMSGWLNVPKLIECTKEKLIGNNAFYNSNFEHSSLIMDESSINYKGLHSKSIVFCEGYRMTHNPFFSTLPMQKVKGEVIVIEDEKLQVDKILKAPVYILPIGNNRYKIGATFEWANFNESTSDSALKELLKKIEPFTSEKVKVISQIGGVRPTVSDRRPLIGRHSDHRNVYIFNGLGTRGVTLAPYFSKELCDLIFKDIPLHEEVDIQRFN